MELPRCNAAAATKDEILPRNVAGRLVLIRVHEMHETCSESCRERILTPIFEIVNPTPKQGEKDEQRNMLSTIYSQ